MTIEKKITGDRQKDTAVGVWCVRDIIVLGLSILEVPIAGFSSEETTRCQCFKILKG